MFKKYIRDGDFGKPGVPIAVSKLIVHYILGIVEVNAILLTDNSLTY